MDFGQSPPVTSPMKLKRESLLLRQQAHNNTHLSSCDMMINGVNGVTSRSSPNKKRSVSTPKRPNIWERLSDPSSFTGVYAERFREGNGGGINASSHDGNIRDLSEITRPSFRTSTHIKIGKGWDPGQHANSGMLCDTPATRRMPESPKEAFLNSSLSSSSISSSSRSTRSRPSSPGSLILQRSLSSASFRSDRTASSSTNYPSSPKHVPPVSPISRNRSLRRVSSFASFSSSSSLVN